MCIMDNGNDPPARIPFFGKNKIPTNSDLRSVAICMVMYYYC